MRAFLAVALILALGLASPAAAGPSALTIAKRADKRSKVALTRASAALAAVQPDPKGADGARGADGRDGATGMPGRDGERGGSSGLEIKSVASTDVTNLGHGLAPVVTLTAAQGFVLAEGQINGENELPDAAYCELRANGVAIAERFVAVPGNGRVAITASATIPEPAQVEFLCRKHATGSVVSFPPERVRLTVLSG